MNRSIRILSLIALLFSCAVAAQAATIFIPGGTIDLLPNLAGQTFFIDISGGEESNGTNVNLQIGDGPALVAGLPYGGTDANKPELTDIRVTGAGQPLIFQGNSTGEPAAALRVIGTTPNRFIGQTGTTTNGDPDMDPDTDDAVPVILNGHLARVTISTVGFPALPVDQLFAITPLLFSGPGIVPATNLPSQVFDGHDPDGPGGVPPSGAPLPVTITGGFLRIPAAAVVTDPAAVTVTPANNSAVAAGSNVSVANAAPVPPRSRDDATVGAPTIGQDLNGTFSLAGALAGAVAAGANRSATVQFDDTGLLNGTQSHGTLDFNVTGGATPGGTGLGPYHYTLDAVAAGNSGTLHAVVAGGGSYAGMGGTSDKSLGSMITFLAGTNAGGDTTANVSWRNRNPNETTPNGTTPPLPDFASGLISDVANVTGTDGDLQVLQMTYDPSQLTGNEALLASVGEIFLASFNTATGFWVNAIDLNHGANVGATNVQGAWSGQLALGTWGVDISGNTVWAVVDHNSEFAGVPEPSTVVLAGLGAMIIAVFARRRRG